jgi:hypothetical protein
MAEFKHPLPSVKPESLGDRENAVESSRLIDPESGVK